MKKAAGIKPKRLFSICQITILHFTSAPEAPVAEKQQEKNYEKQNGAVAVKNVSKCSTRPIRHNIPPEIKIIVIANTIYSSFV